MASSHNKVPVHVEQFLPRSEEDAPDISIIVPAYNEYRRLPPTLLDIINYFESKGRNYEIIVVDDGSTDDTPELVEKFARVRSEITVIRVPQNCGKGNAVRTGMLNASAPTLLFADADGSTPIAELDRLEAYLGQDADLVIGSRALRSDVTMVRTRWYRKFLGRFFNSLVNLLILPGLADTQCGFKLFKRDVARFLFSHQTSNGFGFDVEILYLARKAGLRIKEVPVNWTNVPNSKVNLLLDSTLMFKDILTFKMKHRKINGESFRKFVQNQGNLPK